MDDTCSFQDSLDELLEAFWEVRERGELSLRALEEHLPEGGVQALRNEGMLRIEDGEPVLSEDAETRARDIVRRHRLAERLFYDVLDLTDFEKDACSFEHVISRNVEEALCTFLGHPPTCPHGRPIPKGNCCSALTKKLTPLVSNLQHLDVGAEASVAFLKTAHLDKLAAMGLSPGSTIRLIQKKPVVVIEIDQTTLALDKDIVRGIFVRNT